RSEQLQQHLKNRSYDLIHHHGLWQRPLHYARVAARRQRVPWVLSPRGMMCPWAWEHRRWKKRLASWIVHPGAFAAVSGWHATSAAEADDIRGLGFTQPICVAPNGVVPPSAAEESAAREHWLAGIPALAGRRVALFYSRFHSKKRVLELIDLWLSAPRGDWVLLLVGIPEQYSVNQLDAYVLRNGGTGAVIVHDGAGRPPPYAVSSLFLLPSHSENFGLVVAEALVRGVPALTTDSTPWQELAVQGAGHCVPWSDFGSVLNGLLAESPAALQASGERARTWARTAFSWESVAATLLGFYARLSTAR
ncbi:MAG TPA: glycosyltransferase, partial [Rariglobus sp.]